MKIGQVILGVAAGTAAVCSALAFKTQSNYNDRTQLFIDHPVDGCTQIEAWTEVTGQPTVNKYYTTNACDVTYQGPVTFND